VRNNGETKPTIAANLLVAAGYLRDRCAEVCDWCCPDCGTATSEPSPNGAHCPACVRSVWPSGRCSRCQEPIASETPGERPCRSVAAYGTRGRIAFRPAEQLWEYLEIGHSVQLARQSEIIAGFRNGRLGGDVMVRHEGMAGFQPGYVVAELQGIARTPTAESTSPPHGAALGPVGGPRVPPERPLLLGVADACDEWIRRRRTNSDASAGRLADYGGRVVLFTLTSITNATDGIHDPLLRAGVRIAMFVLVPISALLILGALLSATSALVIPILLIAAVYWGAKRLIRHPRPTRPDESASRRAYHAHSEEDRMDPRLKRQLDMSGLRYTVSDEGNAKVLIEYDDGRSQLVVINSETDAAGSYEDRDVWSGVLVTDGKLEQWVGQTLLEANGEMKIGAFAMVGTTVIFKADAPTECTPDALKTIIRLVAGTAESWEERLAGGSDRF
jgi:hypothetical protein